MTDVPEVSIIIPVFNRVELTRQCFEALYRTVPPGLAEIIVVDNGSRDETPEFLAAEAAAGRIAFIWAGRNLGFARACNLGAVKARGKYLLFLNNDTVPTPGWLEAMLKAAELPGTGIVGAKLLYPDGTVQHAGMLFVRGRPEHIHRGEPADIPQVNHLRDLDMVTGACLLIPKELFFAVGGFDETFLNGYEDVDLCLKVRALGRRVIYQPKAVGYHLEGQSEGRFERDLPNLAQFSARWRACFGRGGRLRPETVPAENLVSKRSLLLSPEFCQAGGDLRVVWQAPLFDLSGYTDEARQFVLGLHEAGVAVQAVPLNWSKRRVKLPPEEALILARLSARILPAGESPAIGVFHAIPDAYRPMPGAGLKIARTMFETDRIPDHWVEILNRFDRVWVPSAFNLETFAASGVNPAKLRVIPSPLDLRRLFQPAEPLDIPGRRSFNFLSVLDFQLRKGWDVLIKAFTEAFRPDEDVALILKVFSYRGLSQARIRTELEKLLGGELPPNLILYFKELGTEEVPRLYAAADAFVLPSRGEGFCRPAAEAMAAGLPVITTGWGGHRDFTTPETAYLIDYKLVPVPEAARREMGLPLPAGTRWAEPSAEHLKALMREVADRPDLARAKAEAGRRRVLAELDRRVITAKIVAELAEVETGRSKSRQKIPAGQSDQCRVPGGSDRPGVLVETDRFSVLTTPEELDRSADRSGVATSTERTRGLVWEGDFSSVHSFARVNRELTRALERAGVSVARVEKAADMPGSPAALWVRHRWPPDFEPVRGARLAIIQPWEYGAVPRAWVEGINRSGAELWVPSKFVRQCFIEGGVPADRVFVVPNGVDPDRFSPHARPLNPEAGALASGRLRFLFVGGSLWRKGIDLLLKAYTKAFGPKDDVVLIIKDVGSASFYRGRNFRSEILRLELEAAAGRAPAVIYIDRELPDDALPGLYAACHCLVHPFRGEGFALPVAEAMATGLPVVVTGAGPVLEFADEQTAYLIPARPKFLPADGPALDGLELVGWPWVFEPDEDALIAALRQVYDHYEAARKKGELAARRIRNTLTWERSARAVIKRCEIIGVCTHTDSISIPVGHAAPPDDRPLISLCMIAKDAAGNLPRCLESVRGVVDEIVVVDTGSADVTPEVALSFGARVVSFPWTGSFAEARNESLRYARGRWVLVLDADEALGRGKERLREILKAADADGFLLPQVTYLGFEPGSADAVVVPALRLFKNLPGLKFTRRLHEQILEGLLETKPSARLQVLDVEIEHFGYLASAGKASEKNRRNIELARRELAERPTDAFGWFNLGQEYYAAGRFEAALFCFRRAVRYLPGAYRMWLPRALELAALSALRLGRPRGALKLLEEAIAAIGDHPNLRLLEGQARLALGEVAAASRAFAKALEAGSSTLDIRSEGASGYAAWYWLGRCAELEGKPQEALGAFVESVRLSLSAGRCYRPAVEALVRLMLPAAQNGRELVEALKNFFPDLPEVFALEAARAVFADPPVKAAGIDAARLLLAQAGTTTPAARVVAGLIELFTGRLSEAAQAAGLDSPLGSIAQALAEGSPLEPVVPPSRDFVGWLLGVLLQTGQFEQFEKLMPLVEKLWPEPAERAALLGRVYSRFEFWDLMVETLAPQALAGRLDGDALSLLATALEKTGNPEAAEEVWLEVIRREPRSFAAARAYAALAALRLAEGRDREAAGLLELAAQLVGR